MRILISGLILFSGVSIAQSSVEKLTSQLDAVISTADQSDELLVWVFFTDKGTDTQGYFSKPVTVVSEKSLKRRSKVLDGDKLISHIDLPVNEDYISQLQAAGFRLKQKSKWFNGVSGYASKSDIVEIAKFQFVKRLDLVYKYRNNYSLENLESQDFPQSGNFTMKPGETYSYNYGQSFTQLNIIKVPDVHNLGYTGTGVTICMMDAGFDLLSHQVFSSMNIIATWDFVNGDPDVQNGSDMGDGSHGTATLSLIGGFYEGQLIGPAFDADFILAKTENTESETPVEEDNWIAALEWADSIGVDLTSTSLSYLDFDPPYQNQSYTWEDMDGNTARITIAADLAVKLGIFVVNSAGNGGYDTHNTLGAPADGDSVIAVGSVRSDGTRSGFSSVGPTVDGRIKPDLMAMGSNNYVACNWNSSCYSSNGSGTSWSCPMLAGAAALLLQIDPNLTPLQLSSLLKNTASKSTSPDNLMGWGIINTYSAAQSLLTSVNEQTVEDYAVLRNYPNPFNPGTTIQFSIPVSSEVKIVLYDMLGRELKELFNGQAETGLQEVVLDGSNLSSGIYLVRMFSESLHKTLKISLLK